MGKKFEELPVWRDGRVLVKDVYSLTRRVPFSRDAGLCDQLQRAAVSICSNIAEGHERGTTPDLVQFPFYAQGSAGEVRSQLYHVEDLGYASRAECERMRQAAEGISRQISSWIKSMQGLGFSAGPKHHKEPDHSAEAFWKKLGMERDRDGIYRPKQDRIAS